MEVGKVNAASSISSGLSSESSDVSPSVVSGGGRAPNESVMISSVDGLARNMRAPNVTQAQAQNFYEIAMKILNAYQEAAAPLSQM